MPKRRRAGHHVGVRDTLDDELPVRHAQDRGDAVLAQHREMRGPDKKRLAAALAIAGQACIDVALDLLREGKPARLTQPKDEEEARVFRQAQLLTAKPVLYVCNVEEEAAAEGNALSARVFEKAKAEGAEAVIVSAASKHLDDGTGIPTGIFHWSDGAVITWFDFACEIQKQALAAGLLKTHCKLIPIPTSDYPTPARRPAYSVMSRRRAFAEIDCPATSWQAELARCLSLSARP